MTIDIRIRVDFYTNPKIRKLERKLGPAGSRALIHLWLFVRQARPTGILAGMDSEDIEIAADWHGEAGLFFRTCTSLGLIEEYAPGMPPASPGRTGTGQPQSMLREKARFRVHGWEDHQAWAVESSLRVEKARSAARSRWGERVLPDAPGMPPAMPPDAPGNAPGNAHNQTQPDTTRPNHTRPKKQKPCTSTSVPYEAIVADYHVALPSLARVRVLGETLKRSIRGRWSDEKARQDLVWWSAYFRFVRDFPFLLGQNKRGWSACLHWLVGKENMEKVLNGAYHQGSGSGRTIFDVLKEFGQDPQETKEKEAESGDIPESLF